MTHAGSCPSKIPAFSASCSLSVVPEQSCQGQRRLQLRHIQSRRSRWTAEINFDYCNSSFPCIPVQLFHFVVAYTNDPQTLLTQPSFAGINPSLTSAPRLFRYDSPMAHTFRFRPNSESTRQVVFLLTNTTTLWLARS